MDWEQIRADFQRQFRGIVSDDEITKAMYSTDASLFQIFPLAVAVPRNEEECSQVIRYASEHNIPIIPRGGGTGVAGESLGAGIVIDSSTHLHQILDCGKDWVRVQIGVVYRQLEEYLAKIGRRLGPDPASASCTIGGMLATNASGARSIKYGSTIDYVRSLKVCWDSGETAILGENLLERSSNREQESERHTGDSYGDSNRDSYAVSTAGGEGVLEESKKSTKLASISDIAAKDPATKNRSEEISQRLQAFFNRYQETITNKQKGYRFDRLGYPLNHYWQDSNPNYAKLLVGSEGTLAWFSEVELQTVPIPEGCSVAMFVFAQLENALNAVAELRSSPLSACELMDRRLLALARSHAPEIEKFVPLSAEAVIIAEWEMDNQQDANDICFAQIDRIHKQRQWSIVAFAACESSEQKQIWNVRDSVLPSLYRLGKGSRPLAFIEDIGVPPDHLSRLIGEIQTILRRYDTTASFLIHAATGQMHTRPFLNLDLPDHRDKLWALANEVYEKVIDLGGTITSQHGTGIARTPWAEKQAAAMMPIYREFKQIFDPGNIWNPGKVVQLDSSRPAWPLRKSIYLDKKEDVLLPGTGRSSFEVDSATVQEPATPDNNRSLRQIGLPLLWETNDFLDQIMACNGCGECRTQEKSKRQCPLFRIQKKESATPRAKANLLREVIYSELPRQMFGSEEVRQVADLCFHCKMCAQECPAQVDIPKLMLQTKNSHFLEHGFYSGSWFRARADAIAKLSSNVPILANAVMRNPIFRWILEKTFGLSRQRQIPLLARRNFFKVARRKGWTQKQSDDPRLAISQRSPANGVDQNIDFEHFSANLEATAKLQQTQTSGKVAIFLDTYAAYYDTSLAEATYQVLKGLGFEVLVPERQQSSGLAALIEGDGDTAYRHARANVKLLANLVRDGYEIVAIEPSAVLMLQQEMLLLSNESDFVLVATHTHELTHFLQQVHDKHGLSNRLQPIPVSLGHHIPCHIKALRSGIHGPKLLQLIPQLSVETIDVGCSGMANHYGLSVENFENSMAIGSPLFDEMKKPKYLFGSSECGSCRMQIEQGTQKRTLHPVQYLALSYGFIPELAEKLVQRIK